MKLSRSLSRKNKKTNRPGKTLWRIAASPRRAKSHLLPLLRSIMRHRASPSRRKSLLLCHSMTMKRTLLKSSWGKTVIWLKLMLVLVLMLSRRCAKHPDHHTATRSKNHFSRLIRRQRSRFKRSLSIKLTQKKRSLNKSRHSVISRKTWKKPRNTVINSSTSVSLVFHTTTRKTMNNHPAKHCNRQLKSPSPSKPTINNKSNKTLLIRIQNLLKTKLTMRKNQTDSIFTVY